MKNDVTVFVIHLRHNTTWSGLDMSLPRLIGVCNDTQERPNVNACKLVTSEISVRNVCTGRLFYVHNKSHGTHCYTNLY